VRRASLAATAAPTSGVGFCAGAVRDVRAGELLRKMKKTGRLPQHPAVLGAEDRRASLTAHRLTPAAVDKRGCLVLQQSS
jgi:hypothetical protein